MAKRKLTRVTQRILKKDKLIASAVLSFKDYHSAHPEFTSERLREAMTKVDAALKLEQEALASVAKAREAAILAEAKFHDIVLGAKRQVIAQYGDDSDEITTLGMKKKSERKYGRPRKDKSTDGG